MPKCQKDSEKALIHVETTFPTILLSRRSPSRLPIFPSFPRNDVSNFVENKKKEKKIEKTTHPTLSSPYHPLQFEAGPLSL